MHSVLELGHLYFQTATHSHSHSLTLTLTLLTLPTLPTLLPSLPSLLEPFLASSQPSPRLLQAHPLRSEYFNFFFLFRPTAPSPPRDGENVEKPIKTNENL